MKVLSLFDGISCGRIALERAEIAVEKYYASEIDKNAIKVSQYNYPDIIQVGDVCQLDGEDFKDVDIILAGSPCQSFSKAGNQEGFSGKSGLFFQFIRLLQEIKPKYFLLENVLMKKEYEDKITEYLGVPPIIINSSLFSAQNRKRLYWTNIPVTQPDDKGILLKDIMDDTYDEELILKGRGLNKVSKERARIFTKDSPKCGCLMVGNKATDAIVFKEGDIYRYPSRREAERLQTLPEGYTDVISYNQAMGAIGNGWTVDVIAHILNPLNHE